MRVGNEVPHPLGPVPSGHLPSRVLYLHGRGGGPDGPPGDLVAGEPWPVPLLAPELDAVWLGRAFSDQVASVAAWMDGALAAIGSSWGGWLLLAAATERVEQGRSVPPLLLLGSVVGPGTHPGGAAMGFIPPRSGRVLAALGLRSRPGSVAIPPGRLTFIHGRDDAQVPVASLAGLPAAGQRVVVVPGGHGLHHTDARAVVRDELSRLRDLLTAPP